MSLRACAGPRDGERCPTGALSKSTRCPACARAKDKARGTRQQRGYDASFDKQKRDPNYLAATHCTRCGQPFTTENPKTAGHTTAIRHGGKGGPIEPQCRRCNYGWLSTNT